MGQLSESSYSFEGEDRIIRSLLRQVELGTYIDIGCNHPVVNSNTYLLYRQGWRGLAVDANSDYKAAWSAIRPNDLFISALLSDNEEKRLFSVFSDPTMSTCDPDTVTRYSERLGKPHNVMDLPATTLNKLLRSSKVDGIDLAELHLISLDVEGEDLKVLKGLDFSAVLPGCIVVETKGLSLASPASHPIYRFLKSKGYSLISKTPLDCFFIHPSKPYFDWIPRELL